MVLETIEDAREGTIDDNAETSGSIDLAESAKIESGAVVRGPVSIAEGTTIKSDTYVGPFTSIGKDCVVEHTHIENSVIIGESEVSASGKIVDSLIGRNAQVKSAEGLLPEGRRLVVGENSNLKL